MFTINLEDGGEAPYKASIEYLSIENNIEYLSIENNI